MPLNNQLSAERRDGSFMVFSSLPSGSGILFEEVTLDESVGPEAVALLIEPEPGELLAKRRLDLNLKAGIAATAYGPVLFLIWWIPPIVDGWPTAFYEQVMNPLYPDTSEVLRRVAEQSHLHVIVTDGTGQVVTVFECKNIFGLVGIRAAVNEQVMNPLYPDTSEVLRRVAEQSHLHVIVTDGTGQVVTVFECKNIFGLVGIRAAVNGARVAWRGPADFAQASGMRRATDPRR